MGQKTDVSIQHSHYKASMPANWDKAAQGLAMIEEAQNNGLEMSMDMYPYTAGSTRLIALIAGMGTGRRHTGFIGTFKRPADPPRDQ